MSKILYIILISLFSLTVISCAKKSDDSSSSTTEIEGTWVESCHADGSYYRINSLTVSGSNFVETNDWYSDSSCTNKIGKYINSYESLSIGDPITWNAGGTGHKFTTNLSDITYTSLTSDAVSYTHLTLPTKA